MSWLLILFASRPLHLILSRTINGMVGGGIFAIAPIFLSEIANDEIRGILGSTLILSLNMGILLGFTFGKYFNSFCMTPWFVIVSTILFGCAFYFFPETPAFLMKQNRMDVSATKMKFKNQSYRNSIHRRPKRRFDSIAVYMKQMQIMNFDCNVK